MQGKYYSMKYSFLFVSCALLWSCGTNDKKVGNVSIPVPVGKDDSTTIQWIDPVVQKLGKAQEGQVLEISWKFKNTGEKPLVFSEVHPGCGCTLADKPEQPVAPGKEGVIKAKFDTKGQRYSVIKNVYVRANNKNKNGEGEDILSFEVEVEPKQAQ